MFFIARHLSIHTRAETQQLHLHSSLQDTGVKADDQHAQTYNHSRAFMVDYLSGQAMQERLLSFPHFTSYQMHIWDSITDSHTDWWTTKVTSNLRLWKDVIEITVTGHSK